MKGWNDDEVKGNYGRFVPDSNAGYGKQLGKCRFGEYSGIGIKTALGMGAVKMLSEEEMRGRRHSAE